MFRLAIGEHEICFSDKIATSVALEIERAIHYRKRLQMEKAFKKRMEMLAAPVDIEINHPDIIKLR